MTAPAERVRLGAEFPAASAEQWRGLALKALRRSGTATEETTAEQVDELLASATYGGPVIAALHTADDAAELPPTGFPGQQPFVRGGRAASGGWDVRQRHADPDPARTGRAVLDDLENGATSLWLVVGDGGLPVGALPQALDGVLLDLAPVFLDPGDAFAEAADAYFALLADRGADPRGVTGGLGADPLGWQARTGEVLDDPARLAVRCVRAAPSVRAITVDATVYHDAGGSEVEELACAAATGVAYLRALTGAGLTVREALSQLEFRYAATVDQFATIAKLRAARRIWARIAELSDAADAGGQVQHAVTSAAMTTARDPWVNLLRGTVAAFAAGVGGAGAVTVLPFDHALGRPDAFARRLARNTTTLLVEEAHAARVIDPAGGSWYVERFTEQLAQAAWEWFTAIERAGGLAGALRSGLIADRIGRTRQAREANIARRRDPITGLSEFPDLHETLPPREKVAARRGGGLTPHRYGEAYERLRERSDKHLAATGQRPTVRLVTLGSPAAHGARLTFATNLFAAGGLAVTTEPGDHEVVCLCGTDRDYAEQAATLAAQLRTGGAGRVLLAGRGDVAGVDTYLHRGCDVIATLTAVLDHLGVPQ